MDETNATAQEVRGKLKAMESANKDDKPGSSEARIRQNMQVTLAKKFMDLMSECVGSESVRLYNSVDCAAAV